MTSVWSEHFTKEGRVYYYNRNTKQSSWEKPADFDGESASAATAGAATREGAAKQIGSGSASTATSDAKKQPKGDVEWEELWDPKNERPYYYNRATRKTQWLRPENVEIKPYGGAPAGATATTAAANASQAVGKKAENKAKKTEKSNGSTSDISPTAVSKSEKPTTTTTTTASINTSAKSPSARRGSVDRTHTANDKKKAADASSHVKKENASSSRREDRSREDHGAETKNTAKVKEDESAKHEEAMTPSSQREDEGDEENENAVPGTIDLGEQNGQDDAPTQKKRKKKSKKEREKGEIESSSSWRKKRRVKESERRMIICDDDDQMQSRKIQEKDTEDGKEATRLLQELSKTDAIMEMNVLNVINGFLRAHNESNGPEILVEALSSSYRGHAQMVGLVASWLDTLPVSKSALEKKVTYDVSEGAVHENKGASWDPAEEILYQHLKDVVTEHYEPKLVRESAFPQESLT